MMYAETDIIALRQEVEKRLSPARYTHTLAVEREVVAIGEIYLPHMVDQLRVAALLHDVTKVGKNEDQFALCEKFGISLTDDERLAPQVLHGKTAVHIVKTEFHQYASPQILSAVEKHTTGDVDMSIFDMIVFLADYIEETRTHSACQLARQAFWSVTKEEMDEVHLMQTVKGVLDTTIDYLREKKQHIDKRTLATQLWLESTLGTRPSV